MELKEFITQTLNDIIDGIVDSQQYAKGKGAMVNAPSNAGTGYYTSDPNYAVGNHYSIREIEFDVAITATEEDKSKGGIGVLPAILNVGVQGEDNIINSEISRVKFSVPVLFPLEIPNKNFSK